MKRILLLLILVILSTHSALPPHKKRPRDENIQCPYCPDQFQELKAHLLEDHKISTLVLSDCLAAITSLNAIKNSRYKIASVPCECGAFFFSQKACLRHQTCSCPLLSSILRIYSTLCKGKKEELLNTGIVEMAPLNAKACILIKFPPCGSLIQSENEQG